MAEQKDELKDITLIEVPPMLPREEVIKKFYETKSPVMLTEVPRIPPLTETDYKALAFDVFMKKYKGYCFLDSWETNTTTHEKEYIFGVGDRHEYITKAEYEILKKAGIE